VDISFHLLSLAVLAGILWSRNTRLMEDVGEIKESVAATAASSQKNNEALISLGGQVVEIANRKEDHETRIRILEAWMQGSKGRAV